VDRRVLKPESAKDLTEGLRNLNTSERLFRGVKTRPQGGCNAPKIPAQEALAQTQGRQKGQHVDNRGEEQTLRGPSTLRPPPNGKLTGGGKSRGQRQCLARRGQKRLGDEAKAIRRLKRTRNKDTSRGKKKTTVVIGASKRKIGKRTNGRPERASPRQNRRSSATQRLPDGLGARTVVQEQQTGTQLGGKRRTRQCTGKVNR